MKSSNPRIAVCYSRVSTSEQGLGLEAQAAALKAWATREKVEIVAWFMDQGVSGGSEMAARPGLVAALGALRAHRAGILAVAKRDRLARDSFIALQIERAAAQCGARVIAADGVGNGSSPADAFMRSMLDAAAQYERGLIKARTKAALAAKKARQERAGNLPYGWRLGPDGVHVEPNPSEQETLRQIHALRSCGRTQRAIAAECTSIGILSRASKPFAQSQIDRLLKISPLPTMEIAHVE